MAKFYHCLRGDSSEYTIMATGLMETKMNETEGSIEDASGKKKSKFKSFKKLFIKKKKKDSSTISVKNSLKQSQSTSDVTYPESHIPECDSESESGAPRGIMGTRALSHDSIFIPDTSVPEPVGTKQVFSQENVSAPIRALQLKVQQNIKLGPPPLSIAAKRLEDPGVSSEDDGLPRSPPESSPLYEILARSSVAKIYPGSGPRPNSPHSPVFQSRTSSGSLSPTLVSIPISPSDTFPLSPAADFSSPAVFTTCLDTSAARHKLSIKPRKQRSTSKQRRSSRPLSGSSSELMYALPEKDENEEEGMGEEVEEVTAAPEITVRPRVESDISSVVHTPPDVAEPSSQETTNILDQRLGESSSLDVTGQQDTTASLKLSDRQDHRSFVPTFVPETEEDVMLMEVETLEVTAAQDPQVLDFVDSLTRREENTPWEANVKSAAREVHSWSLPVDPSWRSKTLCLTTSTMFSDASSPLCSDSEDQSGMSTITEPVEEECADDSSPFYRVHTKLPTVPIELLVLEACSTGQEASKHQTSSPIGPEIFSRDTSTCGSEARVPDKEMTRELAAEDIPSNEEDSEITVFKETNADTSEDKPASQQHSFRTGSQGSFKFSITSAWNRSGRRNGGKRSEDEPVGRADKLELSQKSDGLTREEEEKGKKECDLKVSVPCLSGVKTETHKPEQPLEHKPERCGKRNPEKSVEKSTLETVGSVLKLHEPLVNKPSECVKVEELTEGKKEEAPGLFGVKLRSTSRSLKYKESSHSEGKDVGKRQCAEVAVDSDGPVAQPKAEKVEVKKPDVAKLLSTSKDDRKTKAKSSENLAVKPPLPKKPSLQNVSPSGTTPDKPNKPDKPLTQERQKDTEKSVSKSPDKGQPPVKNEQDSESPAENTSVPAWVNMARQKQKGFHVQHKEVKVQVQDIKATSDWQAKDKESTKPTTELRISFRTSPPPCGPPAPDLKSEPKLKVVELLASLPTVHIPALVDNQPPVSGDKEGRDQPSKEKLSSPASQPSWMELAKKKAKAWSDMPQIIK